MYNSKKGLVCVFWQVSKERVKIGIDINRGKFCIQNLPSATKSLFQLSALIDSIIISDVD